MMSYLQSDTDIANPIAGPAPKETPPEPEYEAQNQRVMGAPRFNIPSRDISAVEIPAIVKNVDRAVKAFGRVPNLTHVLDPTRQAIPLFLNPESPVCNPIMSHNAPSHCVVLKLAVPKRTGRRRKKGSNGPWQEVEQYETSEKQTVVVQSTARLDSPTILRQRLEETAGQYEAEAIGIIKNTHRFRGLADFYWDIAPSPFAQSFTEKAFSGDVNQLMDFKLKPGLDPGPNVDIVPPPIFTHMSLPFNYYYSQNPYVRTTEAGETINMTAVKQIGYFIGAEDEAPTGPQQPPDMTDIRTVEVIAQLEEAFEERPVWTRRALLNQLSGKLRNWNELKRYLNYTAYQFKGGPWRDSVVHYGVDPRTDPKYRIYQTLMFKMQVQQRTYKARSWQALRRERAGNDAEASIDSHVFDGENYDTDGKVWQVCDITDPLLRELLNDAPVRHTCDPSSGWYHGGRWAKVKAIMKTKLVAIQFGRSLTRDDFIATLQFGDTTPTRTSTTNLHIPLPNLRLTKEELTVLRGKEPPKRKSQGYNVRLPRKTPGQSAGPSSVAGHGSSPAPSSVIDTIDAEENNLVLQGDEDDEDEGDNENDDEDEDDNEDEDNNEPDEEDEADDDDDDDDDDENDATFPMDEDRRERGEEKEDFMNDN